MPINIQKNVPLAPFTTIGLGGAAENFVCIQNEVELIEALRLAEQQKWAVYILGGGSNLVVADAGVRGLVVHCQLGGYKWHSETTLEVAAGENWNDLTAKVCEKGLFGIECLGGIPGQVGSTPIQNVGAYGQEVSQTITSVRALKRADLTFHELSNEECQFSYRNSVFKENPGAFIITSVGFRFKKAVGPIRNKELAAKLKAESLQPNKIRDEVIELRRNKSMVVEAGDVNRRSCGSFFVNALIDAQQLAHITAQAGQAPPSFPQADGMIKVPSAWLIEKAGFKKGERRGLVGLSTRHTLALTAQGSATTKALLEFAREIQETVLATFRVQLEPEPRMWG